MNVLAGIGGMSEYSMMTSGIPWPISYSAFAFGSAAIGWMTYQVVRRVNKTKLKREHRLRK